MVPGSTPFTVCVSVASVSAFLALVAIVLILVWLSLRHVSPHEREELEGQISDLRRRLRASQNQDHESRSSSPDHRLAGRIPQRLHEDLRKMKEELAFKQGELSKAWESNTTLKEKLVGMGRELEAERNKGLVLAKQNLHNDRQRATEGLEARSQMNPTQVERLQAENAQLKAQITRQLTEMKQNDTVVQYRLGQGTNRPRQGKDDVLKNEIVPSQMSREWEMKLDDERKQYQDLFARNQYLQDELKAARKYGSMEDQYAGAEVVDKVEKLNSDILQVAATVAEGLDLDEWADDRQSMDSTNGSIEKNLAAIIGRDLARLLRVSESQDLNIVLQTAFQASMTYHTMLITSSWCYRGSQEERLFDESYRSMQKDELQAVCGRWRQLAMTHLKDSRSAHERQLVPRLASTLADVVVAAGYRQDPAIVRKQITSRFENRLQEVIKAAQDLHRVIGEEVTSCDFEVVWFQPGASFDSGLMEDTFGPTTISDVEEVVCITDVGLRSKEKVSGSTKRKQSILLKAKVLLPSGLAGIRVQET